MGLTKKNPQQFLAVGKRPNIVKGVDNLPGKSSKPANHWAILDEIEAPMWADLTLECDSTYYDKDDEWFRISHPVHHCSARELMSRLSLSAEHCMNSGALDLQGSTSPKLPPSVSKSRGKDYKSRKQETLVCSLTLNKQLASKSLSSKSSLINTRSVKAKENNVYSGKVNDHLNHLSDSVGESTLTQNTSLVSLKPGSSFSDKNTSAKSVAFEGEESNSTATIMSEATAGKLIQASTQPLGSIGWLSSNIRESIRKSYVTRQACRVEIKGIGQVEGQKSSSSKSSVGSSSYPGCDGVNTMVKGNNGGTPDSINTKKVHQLPTEKVSRANVYGGRTSQAQKMRCKPYAHENKETSKIMNMTVKENNEGIPDSLKTKKVHRLPTEKVSRANVYGERTSQAQKMRCKPYAHVNKEASRTMDHKKQKEGYAATRKANECIPLSKANNSTRARGINNSSRTINIGKENQSGQMATKSSMKMEEAECPLKDTKVVKKKLHQASDITKWAGPMDNRISGSKVKKSTRMHDVFSPVVSFLQSSERQMFRSYCA